MATQKSEVKLEPIDLTAEEDNQEPIDLGQFQTRSRAQKINALVECKKDRRYRPSHHVNTRKISQMVA